MLFRNDRRFSQAASAQSDIRPPAFVPVSTGSSDSSRRSSIRTPMSAAAYRMETDALNMLMNQVHLSEQLAFSATSWPYKRGLVCRKDAILSLSLALPKFRNLRVARSTNCHPFVMTKNTVNPKNWNYYQHKWSLSERNFMRNKTDTDFRDFKIFTSLFPVLQ